MPLEIKELTIQVNISQESTGSMQNTASGNVSVASGATDTSNQSALIQEMVEKVLEILKSKEER